MGQVLYRKYRSKSLDEIIGQEHITKTLKQAIKTGRISHAYLFTGPRGVGKTSVARILAHEINKLPYSDDSAHLDIIEIDAASNRRIDEIRELRDKVYVAPTSAKYKVYIIDEVHMLTREAFNALLKTLEEPPEHVVFILATTDAHKVPDTITSRTQRFTFKPVPIDKVVDHLAFIAKNEGITVDHDSLVLLAEHGEGSFRDSISLLDQASSDGKKIELDDVQLMLGIPGPSALDELLQALDSGSSATTMHVLTRMYEQGFQAGTIASELSREIRSRMLNNQHHPSDIDLLSDLLRVPLFNPDRFLEICLLRSADARGVGQPADSSASDPIPNAAPIKVETPKIEPRPVVKMEIEEPEPAKHGRVWVQGQTTGDLRAWICAQCGYTELYATNLGGLYETYKKSHRE